MKNTDKDLLEFLEEFLSLKDIIDTRKSAKENDKEGHMFSQKGEKTFSTKKKWYNLFSPSEKKAKNLLTKGFVYSPSPTNLLKSIGIEEHIKSTILTYMHFSKMEQIALKQCSHGKCSTQKQLENVSCSYKCWISSLKSLIKMYEMQLQGQYLDWHEKSNMMSSIKAAEGYLKTSENKLQRIESYISRNK